MDPESATAPLRLRRMRKSNSETDTYVAISDVPSRKRDMADISPRTIVCKFVAHGKQWVAHFEGCPQVAFGADLPMSAVRRLLDGTEARLEKILNNSV